MTLLYLYFSMNSLLDIKCLTSELYGMKATCFKKQPEPSLNLTDPLSTDLFYEHHPGIK